MTVGADSPAIDGDEPLVTVVTPTYNDAPALRRAIECVQAQTYDAWEHVVVDDASTDDPESVVESVGDSRLEFIQHDENRGGAAARNTGIERASGKYVAFLDADDEWLPDKLRAQVSRLESESDAWIAAYCDTIRQRHGPDSTFRKLVSDVLRPFQSESEGDLQRSGGEELIGPVLTKRLTVSGGATLIVRRDVVERMGGFDESFERHQDLEFTIRLLKEGQLAYVDSPLAVVNESATADPDVILFAKMRYFTRFEDEVRRLESEGQSVIGTHWYFLSKSYYRHGRFRGGIQFMIGADIQGVLQYLGLLHSMGQGISRRIRGLLRRD